MSSIGTRRWRARARSLGAFRFLADVADERSEAAPESRSPVNPAWWCLLKYPVHLRCRSVISLSE